MSQQFVHGVFSLLALVCLVSLFYTAWQSVVIDGIRQRIFEIRDRTFLWAYDNGRLEDRDYRRFRELANASIRHYENTSILKLVLLATFFHLGSNKLERAVIFPKDAHLAKEYQRITRISLYGLILRSLPIMILSAISVPIIGFMAIVDTNWRATPRKVERRLSNELEAELLAVEAAA